MLKDSLGISIDPVLGVLSEVTYTICEACILRLKDAFEFKKQVRKCEEKFKDFCNRNAIKVASENSDNLDIKIELPESLSDFRVDSFDDDDDDDDNKFDIFDNFNSKDQTKSPKLDSGSKQKSINTTKNKAKTKLEQIGGNQSVKKEEAVDEKKKSENKSAEKKNSMDDWFDDDDDDDDDDGFDNFDNFDSEDQIKKDTSPTLDSGSRQKGKITKTKAKTKSEQKKGKQSVEEEAADGKKKTGNKSAEKKVLSGILSQCRGFFLKDKDIEGFLEETFDIPDDSNSEDDLESEGEPELNLETLQNLLEDDSQSQENQNMPDTSSNVSIESFHNSQRDESEAEISILEELEEDSDESEPEEDGNWCKSLWISRPEPEEFDRVKTVPVYLLNSRARPLAHFEKFFNENVYDLIVAQTNLYAEQKKLLHWEPVTKPEIKAFLGILIIMGYIILPHIDLYWSRDPGFRIYELANVMPIKRFKKILQALHLNDNSLEPKKRNPGP
ncbi:unnamed protein product [Parnassius apollo]|uniref:(apollo) hypothetical protein n=1 Tax=Parnassius apollo TaxID=110799 RepID=A0A8S3Y8U9_PARAO|nr:unnamed protein product [Parnassius apollo]